MIDRSLRAPSATPPPPRTTGAEGFDPDLLARGQAILAAEGEAILNAAQTLSAEFCRAVRLIEECTGSVVVTGVGKAGLVARKISATLASTGSPSHFLHPVEAMHGDLGAIRGDDVVMAVSQSGESEEITRLLPHLAAMDVPIVAVTAGRDNTLGRAATVVVATGRPREACDLGLAPSTSTAVMLALGDAVALTVSMLRRFTHEDFARRHPGGSLGRQLATVDDSMRPLAECRIASPAETVREVFGRTLPARRTGAVMIVDDAGALVGIFTDSDLARLFERRLDTLIDARIESVMTRRPATVPSGKRLQDAVAILERHRLSELPVVDQSGRPLGLLDIVDLVGLVPPELLEGLGGLSQKQARAA